MISEYTLKREHMYEKVDVLVVLVLVIFVSIFFLLMERAVIETTLYIPVDILHILLIFSFLYYAIKAAFDSDEKAALLIISTRYILSDGSFLWYRYIAPDEDPNDSEQMSSVWRC